MQLNELHVRNVNVYMYVNVQSSNHLNLLIMMYLGDLHLHNLRLLTVKRHGSGKLLPISLLAMINRRFGANVCYPWAMVQNVTLYLFIVEV